MIKDVIDRFWAKVDKKGSCWLWTAHKNEGGYGRFTYNVGGKPVCGYAHRIAWILHNRELKAGEVVRHSCHNPSCVNPAHLNVGGISDNNQDRMKRYWPDSGNFLDSLVARPSTIKTQTSLFTNHIHPYLPKELGDGNQLLINLYNKWTEADLSPGTKRSLVSLFKRFYEWETGQKLDTERTRRIQRYLSRLERPQHATLKVWNRDNCRRALDAARHLDKKLYLMLLISLHTGVRRGELFGLKWGDVDFVRGELIVQRSYDGPTKSGKPRSIPLSQELERELQNGYTVGREDDYIFRWTDPNPKLAALCRNAEVPEITWHGLRHTFATLALESGLVPTQVQDMMGHAKLSTLLDTYWQFFGNKPDMEFVP